MKILLIHPKLERNFFNDIQLPPLGLAYIAGVLRRAEYDVQIFDAILSCNQLQEIKETVTNDPPDVVGISVTSSLVKISLKIAGLIKAIDPDIATILGGVHPTLFPRQMIQSLDVDYVVCGEGEHSLLELLEAKLYFKPDVPVDPL